MSESRMRSVLETAADGIITTDEKGIIQSVNPAPKGSSVIPAEN